MTYKEIFDFTKPFIVIAGIIGSGKSEMTKNLAKATGLTPMYEGVDKNMYLDDFYKDMSKYGFEMQVFLYTQRFQQHQQIVHGDKGVVQDRSIYEDVIFAKMLHEQGNMSDRSFKTYVYISEIMRPFLRPPTAIVFLDVRPEVALERARVRARESESSLSLEYLYNLQKGYEDWLASEIPISCPKMRLDWNEFLPTPVVVKNINNFLEEKGCNVQL